jgi:hypothetical protein
METAGSSEMLANFYKSILCSIPKESTYHKQCHTHLKCHLQETTPIGALKHDSIDQHVYAPMEIVEGNYKTYGMFEIRFSTALNQKHNCQTS